MAKINITKKGKIVLLALATLLIGGVGYWYLDSNNLLERQAGGPSTTIEGLNVGSVNAVNEARPELRPVFTTDQVQAEGVGVWRHQGIAWNGQMGMIYANGGASTQSGSIMSRYGIRATITRQDDYNNLAGELLRFAQAFAGGDADPDVGVHSVVIMGDAAPGFLGPLQEQLDRLNLHARIIGAPGRSFGEDKCMGPPEWFDDPQQARGGVIAGVLRDGDIHICLIWAQANGIPVNPDPRTYDPEALNFYATTSFTEADQAYISGQCEERPVVQSGVTTGRRQRVCVQGTATWTPGDVNVVQNKGGVVSLLSTRENSAQMFATIIVIDEWARANPATVTNFLKATLDGSATIANDRAQLRTAACQSAQVWREQDCDYWERYYYSRVEDDRVSGRQVRLGGSQALGLASNLEYFLPPAAGGLSVYERVYRAFGELDRRLYPNEMPEYPENVVNTMFLERIRDFVGDVGQGDVFGQFDGGEATQVGARSYSINFEVGSARILESSFDDLEQILQNVTVGANLAIEVNGFASTDGTAAANQRLSEARAQAVRDWLIQRGGGSLIAANRIRVTGYGAREDRLLCRETTEACHRQNRRVEIRLLSGD